MHKKGNIVNNRARYVKFAWFTGGVGGEHDGVGFVAICNVFVMEYGVFFRKQPFDRL